MANDIADRSFWDRFPHLKPYALLARWDRPIGFWLLFWPCVWGAALSPGFRAMVFQNRVGLILMIFIGAIAMRGAGCTLNDLFDRKLDAQVARTRTRPLASGAVKPWQAVIFLILQTAIGALVLFQLPRLAIIIGLCTLPVIAVYPLMKRYVWWPQFVLSSIFASGALVGWAATSGTLGWPALFLYLAGICWVIAYDTVYAQMDTADDTLIGIRSTALWWAPYLKLVVGWLWAAMGVLFAVALFLSHAPILSYLTLGFALIVEAAAHLSWRTENTGYALRFFRLQHPIGCLLALSALAPVLL